MFDQSHRFLMEQYARKSTFSSFLPGIAGPHGIPVWCYYNNRGQCVCSFGSSDKDHSIMEFSPAHVAYQNVQRTGFRTFLKYDGQCIEPFADGRGTMHIGMNELEITWENSDTKVSALYFVLPQEAVGALTRIVTVTNTGSSARRIEMLDGMPALVPYGISQDTLKNMTQLAKAWMQAEDAEKGEAFFRTRASMADSTIVTKIEGGNFALAEDGDGNRLCPIVQPELVFGEDTGLASPEAFCARPLDELMRTKQVTNNLFPCAFFGRQAQLAPGESMTLYELYGQVENKKIFHAFAETKKGAQWFAAKHTEARTLTEELCEAVDTHTADPVFDAYCRQTYLDNLLRGGVPTVFADGEDKNVFYLYSRKHGDPEREYNYFVMTPEYYSQGNGNYRDVNQNRRCDVLFEPAVGDSNIRLFFSLIQSDGYNPLVIEAMTFRTAHAAKNVQLVPAAARSAAAALLEGEFTPGRLAMEAEKWGFADAAQERDFVRKVMAHAAPQARASFGEGYWTDHWTYNLDLIESYLAVYPEKKEELLFGHADLPWSETPALVLPREKRYRMTENGLRQYVSLDRERKAGTARRWMAEKQGAGETARSTLMEKIVLLCAIKYATLDAAGMGVEMEGGKPGWYDALNGLPGLLGSSMPESCELARLLAFAADALEQYPGSVALYTEMADLVEELAAIAAKEQPAMQRWDALNACKEAYREKTADGVDGAKREMAAAQLAKILRLFERQTRAGIARAVEIGNGVCPAYFRFEAEDVRKTAAGLMPGKLTPVALPHFLEGPTRWMKLALPVEEKRACAEKVRAGGLYDAELAMYKVNENMDAVTFEAGRARAFTRGWLENESIWLHMEYKYLLEELKNGLYPEFSRDFHAAAVPFLSAEKYGRSPLENVSFLASSANPNPAFHGRGFVARLSGSTAEFLQMWEIMMFGAKPFTVHDGRLALAFTPFVPEYLVPENGEVKAVFLGHTAVTLHITGKRAIVPGECAVTQYTLTMADGSAAEYTGPCLPEAAAQAVRNGQVKSIRAEMQ